MVSSLCGNGPFQFFSRSCYLFRMGVGSLWRCEGGPGRGGAVALPTRRFSGKQESWEQETPPKHITDMAEIKI